MQPRRKMVKFHVGHLANAFPDRVWAELYHGQKAAVNIVIQYFHSAADRAFIRLTDLFELA